ncbi:hypothetical protein SELMODRAFT_424771 [Selaginella moellendorffii]|uniref:Uncharacterized protein n=1 Tax=Selaginella moellendorffii TaxID=88036 RepID=D8SRK9_SELML|nr:hypothetical protein SELMODRAFT_424771 [Selaginella moellendorffii]
MSGALRRNVRLASQLGVRPVCPLMMPNGPIPWATIAAPIHLPKRQEQEEGLLHRALTQCKSAAKLRTVSKFVSMAAHPHEEEAAALDMHEAASMEYLLQYWDSPETDETLFLVLAVCYIARLSGAERSACAATLGWDGAREQLDCMVDFSRQELLSTGSAGLRSLGSSDSSKQDEEMPARNTIAMDYWASPPYRKPSNGEFRWLCQGDKLTNTESKESSRLYGVAAVPKLFGLVSKILKADFFLTLPVERLGWNMLSCKHSSNRDGVRRAYSQLTRHPLDPPPMRVFPYEMDSAPLRVKELVLLLQGIENNKLLRSLVTERPPLSVLPHHHAIWNCKQHARIWLARHDLRIYYDHNLTYGRLGTLDAAEEEEEEVLLDAFCKERTPSVIEHTLRTQTQDIMWEEIKGEMVMHMRPEDYDVASHQTQRCGELIHNMSGIAGVDADEEFMNPGVLALEWHLGERSSRMLQVLDPSIGLEIRQSIAVSNGLSLINWTNGEEGSFETTRDRQSAKAYQTVYILFDVLISVTRQDGADMQAMNSDVTKKDIKHYNILPLDAAMGARTRLSGNVVTHIYNVILEYVSFGFFYCSLTYLQEKETKEVHSKCLRFVFCAPTFDVFYNQIPTRHRLCIRFWDPDPSGQLRPANMQQD